MGKPPRRGIATMKLDLDFFDDPAVQELYEENTPEDADGAAMLFLRMAMRAHRLDRPDVLAEFQRSKNERRQRLIATLVNAGLIDSNGIRPSTFDKWRMPDRGWYDSERGRAGGLARAEQMAAERSASVEPALHSVDAAYVAGAGRSGSGRSGVPSLLEGSSSPNDDVEGGDERSEIQKRDDEAFGYSDKVRSEFDPLARKAEELTGSARALPNPFGGYALKLYELVDIHGLEAVLAAMSQVRAQLGRRMTSKELIFGTETIMSRSVSAATAVKDERQGEIEDDHRRRLDRTQLTLHGYGQHSDGPDNHPACPACRGDVAV